MIKLVFSVTNILALFSYQVIEGLSDSDLFPFGISAGDSIEFPNDDSFNETFITKRFPFFNRTYSSLWVRKSLNFINIECLQYLLVAG